MTKRKESSYSLKGTKKTIIGESKNRISISNSHSLICLNDHFQATIEASTPIGTQFKVNFSSKHPMVGDTTLNVASK